MFAARTSLRRTSPSAFSRVVVRKQTVRRFQSTKPKLNAVKEAVTDGSKPLLIAGAVGGLVTLTGVYAWYHLSGTSKVIKAARKALDAAEAAKHVVTEHTPSRGEIVVFLRSNMAPYLAYIPGAQMAFDEIDSIADTHGDELDVILSDAYGDLKDVLDKGGLDKQTAMAVTDIAKRLARDLKDLSMDAGEKLLEENPKLKAAMECPVLQLKELGRRYGPEAQKIVDETYKQVKEIVNQGLSPEALDKASKLIEEKSAQIKEMGRKAIEKAFEEGSQEVKRYLDRAPQVKKLLEENMEDIKEAALSGKLSVSQIPQIFQKAKDATTAIDKKTAVERLKRYLDDLTGKGKEKIAEGGEHLQRVAKVTRDYVKSFPWGEEALEQMPDLNELVVTVHTKGPEAERLATDTAKEIAEILKKKVEEAKKLAKE